VSCRLISSQLTSPHSPQGLLCRLHHDEPGLRRSYGATRQPPGIIPPHLILSPHHRVTSPSRRLIMCAGRPPPCRRCSVRCR
jgi:hypothetical protein